MPSILAALAVLASAATLVSAQSLPREGPPLPFEDYGACPFELCSYGAWTARETSAVRRDRRRESPVAFRIARGETVTALTGVVVTRKAGRVQFRIPHEMNSTSGIVRVEPGQTLYLLTYLGEGFTKAWFNGRLYDDLDGSEFFDAACEDDPRRCAGTIVEKPQREWWVQVRDATGRVGWTDEPDNFIKPRVG